MNLSIKQSMNKIFVLNKCTMEINKCKMQHKESTKANKYSGKTSKDGMNRKYKNRPKFKNAKKSMIKTTIRQDCNNGNKGKTKINNSRWRGMIKTNIRQEYSNGENGKIKTKVTINNPNK